MSTKHVRTAADLVRFGCALRIECNHCAATNTLSAVEVARIHSSNVSLELLHLRLKCRHCRLRVAKIAVLSPL
jgi:hypothetical protein